MKNKIQNIIEKSKEQPNTYFAVLLGESNNNVFSGNGKVKRMREADSLGKATHFANQFGRNSWIVKNGELFPA